MPIFSYRAIDSKKNVSKGTISSRDEQEVVTSLGKKGLTLLSVKKAVQTIRHSGSLPTIEKITFCRYVSSMLASGLSLSEGIEVLEQETKHPLMRQLLSDISYGLEHGQPLSTIFAQYPNVFDQFFLTLVTVGEVSGTLADVFSYLEKGLRAEYSMNQKIKGALMYPVVVLFAMGAVGLLMFFFVLPQIGRVFLNMRLPLPAFTRGLFIFSLALSRNMIPIFAGLGGGLIALIFLLQRNTGKRIFFGSISYIPLVRNLIKQIDMARFTRIFSTLVRSAVPITQALEIALTGFSWSGFRMIAEPLKKAVIEGKPLSLAFKEQQVFPALLIQMIAAGEKTGTLDKTLGDLASFYEEKVEEEVKGATQVLEPILILLVGIGVGVMILSVIAPIYSVVSSLQQGGKP